MREQRTWGILQKSSIWRQTSQFSTHPPPPLTPMYKDQLYSGNKHTCLTYEQLRQRHNAFLRTHLSQFVTSQLQCRTLDHSVFADAGDSVNDHSVQYSRRIVVLWVFSGGDCWTIVKFARAWDPRDAVMVTTSVSERATSYEESESGWATADYRCLWPRPMLVTRLCYDDGDASETFRRVVSTCGDVTGRRFLWRLPAVQLWNKQTASVAADPHVHFYKDLKCIRESHHRFHLLCEMPGLNHKRHIVLVLCCSNSFDITNNKTGTYPNPFEAPTSISSSRGCGTRLCVFNARWRFTLELTSWWPCLDVFVADRPLFNDVIQLLFEYMEEHNSFRNFTKFLALNWWAKNVTSIENVKIFLKTG